MSAATHTPRQSSDPRPTFPTATRLNCAPTSTISWPALTGSGASSSTIRTRATTLLPTVRCSLTALTSSVSILTSISRLRTQANSLSVSRSRSSHDSRYSRSTVEAEVERTREETPSQHGKSKMPRRSASLLARFHMVLCQPSAPRNSFRRRNKTRKDCLESRTHHGDLRSMSESRDRMTSEISRTTSWLA